MKTFNRSILMGLGVAVVLAAAGEAFAGGGQYPCRTYRRHVGPGSVKRSFVGAPVARPGYASRRGGCYSGTTGVYASVSPRQQHRRADSQRRWICRCPCR